MANLTIKADALDVQIGLNLRRKRKAAGMTLDQLAVRLGVTYQQVMKYEAGRNRITAAALWRAHLALGSTMDELLADLPREFATPSPGR